MWSIIDSSNAVVGICDLEPDSADLASRGEQAIDVGNMPPALGDVWDGTAFTTPAPTLAEAQAAKRAEIRAAAQAAITGGVQSSVLGSVHTYPTTETDQQNLTGLVLRADIDAVGGKFWCADSGGTWARRDHTAAQIIQLGREVADHVAAQQAHYEALLAQIESASAVADVEAITW